MDGFVMNKTKLFIKCKFFRKIGWLGFFLLEFVVKPWWLKKTNMKKLLLYFILSDSAFDCGWVVFSKSVDHH